MCLIYAFMSVLRVLKYYIFLVLSEIPFKQNNYLFLRLLLYLVIMITYHLMHMPK